MVSGGKTSPTVHVCPFPISVINCDRSIQVTLSYHKISYEIDCSIITFCSSYWTFWVVCHYCVFICWVSVARTLLCTKHIQMSWKSLRNCNIAHNVFIQSFSYAAWNWSICSHFIQIMLLKSFTPNRKPQTYRYQLQKAKLYSKQKSCALHLTPFSVTYFRGCLLALGQLGQKVPFYVAAPMI